MACGIWSLQNTSSNTDNSHHLLIFLSYLALVLSKIYWANDQTVRDIENKRRAGNGDNQGSLQHLSMGIVSRMVRPCLKPGLSFSWQQSGGVYASGQYFDFTQRGCCIKTVLFVPMQTEKPRQQSRGKNEPQYNYSNRLHRFILLHELTHVNEYHPILGMVMVASLSAAVDVMTLLATKWVCENLQFSRCNQLLLLTILVMLPVLQWDKSLIASVCKKLKLHFERRADLGAIQLIKQNYNTMHSSRILLAALRYFVSQMWFDPVLNMYAGREHPLNEERAHMVVQRL